jgi:hypothetical protein
MTRRVPLVLTDAEETAEFERVLLSRGESIADLSIDAFADGVIAHREGKEFHENPGGIAPTLSRLSWSLGWNERALRVP